ncbi:Retrovirus-related Pol polyprotein from transposon 17.6 [Vitis vinifera]|uniref:Retrovirus-related Pol polyprotein from transposon 17.6 n=1 Tax=Vitis vinifera TaxID=29760 RepID=A0A438FWC6_VITVI|nr:Retrovirus-related Pol polyprotein from transposon 17.6 [Vitis vinifera]
MGSLQLLNALKAKRCLRRLKAKANKAWSSKHPRKEDGSRQSIHDKPSHGVARGVTMHIGSWEGRVDFTVAPMDDFKMVLGMDFLQKVKAVPLPFLRSMAILEEESHAWSLRSLKVRQDPYVIAMQVKKGLKREEEREDHKIELEPGAKPPAMGPYRMAPPELEELRRQLKELLDAGFIQPSKAPYGAPVYFKRNMTGQVLHEAGLKVRLLPSQDCGGDEPKTTCVTRSLRSKAERAICKEGEVLFAKEEVSFLGHRIRDGKLMMDDSKVKAIQEWDPPTKGAPLTDLLKKNKAWEWDERCQQAFEDLKKAVTEEPVLALPDHTKVLRYTQMPQTSLWGSPYARRHPIAFESRKLNDTERRYTVQKKECHRPLLAHLEALSSRVSLHSEDRQCATSYFQTQKLSPKQARWQDFLAEFDYTLEYKPGSANHVADALSLGWAPWATTHEGTTRVGLLLASIRDEVEAYVRTCLVCQQDKVEQRQPRGLLEPLPIERPWTASPWTSSSATQVRGQRLYHSGGGQSSIGGCLSIIISDRDPLHWEVLDGTLQAYGFGASLLHKLSPTDGWATERVNALLELYLRHFVSANQKDWAKLLDIAQFSYNLQRSEATNKSPGFQVRKGWHEQADIARSYLDKAAKKMKKWADKKRRHTEYKVGDMVGKVSYKVELPRLKIHPVFHTVIRRRGVPPATEYLVKWKGLPESEASWEPAVHYGIPGKIERFRAEGATRTSAA